MHTQKRIRSIARLARSSPDRLATRRSLLSSSKNDNGYWPCSGRRLVCSFARPACNICGQLNAAKKQRVVFLAVSCVRLAPTACTQLATSLVRLTAAPAASQLRADSSQQWRSFATRGPLLSSSKKDDGYRPRNVVHLACSVSRPARRNSRRPRSVCGQLPVAKKQRSAGLVASCIQFVAAACAQLATSLA